MKDIYSRAAEVIMWLGEEADDSSVVLALIERWSAGAGKAIGDGSNLSNMRFAHEMISYIENPFEEKGSIALDVLFLRPYWKKTMGGTRGYLCIHGKNHMWKRQDFV